MVRHQAGFSRRGIFSSMTDPLIPREFVGRLAKKLGPNLVKAVFFGSRARGTEKPWSDYDILLVLRDKNKKSVDTIYEEVTDFLLEREVDISLKVLSEKQYQQQVTRRLPFIMEVQKTGVALYG